MLFIISPELYLVSEKVVPFDNSTHFAHPFLPTFGKHQSVLCIYKFGFFQGPSMLSQIAEFPFFMAENIPLYLPHFLYHTFTH